MFFFFFRFEDVSTTLEEDDEGDIFLDSNREDQQLDKTIFFPEVSIFVRFLRFGVIWLSW